MKRQYMFQAMDAPFSRLVPPVGMEYVLCSKITNGELAKNNLGTGVVDGLKLVVDNLPFGIDNSLVLGNLLDANLGVVLLTLQLQLNVETHNLRVLEELGLLLETSVGECLLESDTVDEKGLLKTTTSNLLHTNQLLVQVVLV